MQHTRDNYHNSAYKFLQQGDVNTIRVLWLLQSITFGNKTPKVKVVAANPVISVLDEIMMG